MVHKQFCDICGSEIAKRSEDFQSPAGYFNYLADYYDLCKHCGDKVKQFIEKEKERYTVLGVLKKKLVRMKNQKKLGDFEREIERDDSR